MRWRSKTSPTMSDPISATVVRAARCCGTHSSSLLRSLPVCRAAHTVANGWQKRTIAAARVRCAFRAVHVACAASAMCRSPVLSAHVNASIVSIRKMLASNGST